MTRTVQVLVLLFVFLVGVQGMGTGFKGLGKDLLDSFFQATSNPFVGLLVGVLGIWLPIVIVLLVGWLL